MKLSTDMCSDQNNYKMIADTVKSALNSNSGKIGVILPFVEPYRVMTTSIISGLRIALQERGVNPDTTLVIRDSRASGPIALQMLAELVLQGDVGFVVGGVHIEDARVLAEWSDKIFLPTLLLTRDEQIAAGTKNAFRVYPSQRDLAKTLAQGVIYRGWKRIAIMRPQNHKADELISIFQKELETSGGVVVRSIVYDSQNYNSMEGVTRQLFQIDMSERHDNYAAKFDKMKLKAKKEGDAFNPKGVYLDPIVDMDAVLIPDDFRTVRHFAKIFKYHGVQKVGMIGNHEWRSQGLLKPQEPFLNGAIFADFIGSYREIPRAIPATETDSPYFTVPDQVVDVDFKLIGYRAGTIALEAIQVTPQGERQKRRVIPQRLVSLQGDQNNFFGYGPVFDAERRAKWPTFLFTVSGETIAPQKADLQVEPFKTGH